MQPSAEFHKAVEEQFFQRILIIYPGSKIYTANAKWIEPKDAIFFSLHIIQGDAFNTTIGTKKWERTPFVVHIAVYAPSATFERESWERAESAARIFANTDMRIGPSHKAVFRAPSIQAIPDQKSTKYRVIGKVAGWRDFAG